MEKQQKATIFTTEGDSKAELTDIIWQLDKWGVKYSFSGGLISERYLPIVEINGCLYEGSRQLFNYFRRKENLR